MTILIYQTFQKLPIGQMPFVAIFQIKLLALKSTWFDQVSLLNLNKTKQTGGNYQDMINDTLEEYLLDY